MILESVVLARSGNNYTDSYYCLCAASVQDYFHIPDYERIKLTAYDESAEGRVEVNYQDGIIWVNGSPEPFAYHTSKWVRGLLIKYGTIYVGLV